MNLLKSLWKALTQPDPMEWETHRSAIMARRSKALMAYVDAVDRGDCRDQSRAFKAVQEATHDLLRAEVAR